MLGERETVAEIEKLTFETQQMRVRLIQKTGEITEAPKTVGRRDVIAVHRCLEEHFMDLSRKLLLATASNGDQTIDHVEAIAARNQLLQAELTTTRTALAEGEAKIKTLESRYSDFDKAVSLSVAEQIAQHGISTATVSHPKGVRTPEEMMAALAQSGNGKKSDGSGSEVNYTMLCMEQIAAQGGPKLQNR